MRHTRRWLIVMGAVGTILAVVGPPTLGQQSPSGQPIDVQKVGADDLASTIDDAQAHIYKRVGDTELRVYVYRPESVPPDPKPAIVFFFGGGWRSGSPAQFAPHCRYLARRGMIAMVCDYRVAERHGVLATACVEDAKSAMRWIRGHASELEIDPDRIVAAGGSAGGHLAACTAFIEEFNARTDDLSVSPRPNALALFNPALILAAVPGKLEIAPEDYRQLERRVGVAPEHISPYHHLEPPLPPTIIFHGEADTTVPFETAQWFAEKMRQLGGHCVLHSYPGATHGFFNARRDSGKAFRETLQQLDAFLVALEYLEPQG